MSRSPSGSSRMNGSSQSGFRSSPKGLRKNTGRTSLFAVPDELPLGNPLTPTRSVCRSLRAIPPPDDLGTTQAGRNRIDHSHAGFPQGLLTRRFSSYLVSYWLTNAIDRIVKETTPRRTRDAPELPARPLTTCGGGCFALIHRRHRPVQGCIIAARPGRRLTMVVSEAKAILTRKAPRSTPLSNFFPQ